MIVLIVAYCVKLKLWIQDRKYDKKMAAEQAEHGEAILVSRVSSEIPFGIRALIEEAEVEGIWRSRTLTPLQQNDDLDHHSDSADCLASSSHTRRNSSASSTSIYDAADISNASPYGRRASPTANYLLIGFQSSLAIPETTNSSPTSRSKNTKICYRGPATRRLFISETYHVRPSGPFGENEGCA